VIGLFVLAETRLYREGLVRALDEDERFRVVGSAADVPNALELVAGPAEQADVVLLDHAIPEGPEAVRQLRRASPGIRVLALAVREAEGDVIPWAEAGAAGFMPGDASLDDLAEGISAVAGGASPCSPRVAALLLDRVASLAERRRSTPPLGELTQRESDVARLLERGLSNKEIALELRIEVATVKNHVHNILEKLDVQRRGEAASVIRAGTGI
jgi:DNA-binding NarL/FixJ family response regulator